MVKLIKFNLLTYRQFRWATKITWILFTLIILLVLLVDFDLKALAVLLIGQVIFLMIRSKNYYKEEWDIFENY